MTLLQGVADLIHIKSEKVEFPKLHLQHIDEKPVDRDKRLKAIIKAHKELMKIDERNVEIFGPFLKAIIKELGEQCDSE